MISVVEFLRAGLRLSAPLLLASLGGSFTYHAGVLNIAMEGMMLFGAFAAFTIALASDSYGLGLVAAMGASLILALMYAFFVLKLRADVFAIGIALNIFAAGVTAYILRSFYKQEGVLVSSDIRMLPELSFGFLTRQPILDLLFNRYSLLIPTAFLLVLLIHLFLYKTPAGYWMRAAGENPEALESVGRQPGMVKLGAFLLSGVLCGLAGAHLSIGYLGIFALGMVAGRGFIALAVVLFGRGRPLTVLIASLIFGFAEAAALRMPIKAIAPQFSLMFPYIITIVAITLMSARRARRAEG